jgi:hypothetical protein
MNASKNACSTPYETDVHKSWAVGRPGDQNVHGSALYL